MAAKDEDPPLAKPTALPQLGADLSQLSVGELEEYTTALVNEVERVKAVIAAKKAALNAADSVFRL